MISLVTGSSGYVGSFLVPALQAEGHTVIGIDKVQPSLSNPDYFFQGDLLDDQMWAKIFANHPHIDLLIHLAAAKDDWGISDEEYFEQNVAVTKKILQKANTHGIKNHLFYSTVSVYGSSDKPLSEDAEKSPDIAYGESKLEAENVYKEFHRQEKFDSVTVIRPSVIYGKYHYTNVCRFIDAINNNRFIMIGDGTTLKTTSYIENVVDASIFLLKKQTKGWQTYNYVDEPKITTGEMADLIYKFTGKKKPSFSLPLNLIKSVAYLFDVTGNIFEINFPITAERIEKFCTATNFDASAIRELGFSQPYSNEAAFKKTIDWQMNARNN